MAMLADNKKKQKWSHDPRNTAWSNDTNRFGYQLMTKMGWESGKGLGAREHGQTSHIKTLKRKTNIGLGADQSNDDNWLAHQEAFNDLLSHLNDVNQNGDDSATDDTKYDMEKKARESRKRVFYNRFIKSKDTSAYSSTDMACIMGQRSKSAPATPVEQSEDSDSGDSTASCPTAAVGTSTSHGVTTINTGQNIQEYFAKKMQELQAARFKDKTDEANGSSGDATAVENSSGKGSLEQQSRSKSVDSPNGKKRKKSKRDRCGGDAVVEDSSGKNSLDQSGESVDSPNRKKRKKEKWDYDVDAAMEHSSGKSNLDQESSESVDSPKEKKRKKLSRRKRQLVEGALTSQTEDGEFPSKASSSKSKKKRKDDERKGKNVTNPRKVNRKKNKEKETPAATQWSEQRESVEVRKRGKNETSRQKKAKKLNKD